MKKILIIQPQLKHYRIPIFNRLAQNYYVTVLHSGAILKNDNIKFGQCVTKIKRRGPFFYLRINLYKLCNKFDVIISEGNIRHIDRNILIVNPFRKFKWINWSIGVSADYDKPYDSDTKYDFIRFFLSKKSNANVFYSEYPKSKYLKAGVEEKKIFIANNTMEVFYNENETYSKNKILFVGTLYKQKKIYELLKAYKDVYNEIKLPLTIIGDGDEYDNIKQWIASNNLNDKIILTGAIFDPRKLEKHFRESIACISPGQAGLSVLTSMGFGVPFVTKKSAITGGEIFNINHNVNGLIYNSDNELCDILRDIGLNRNKFLEMGKNAKEFYDSFRTPDQMAEDLLSAINYALMN